MSKRAEKKAAKAAAARQAAVENRVVDAGDWLAKEIGALVPRLQDGVRSGASEGATHSWPSLKRWTPAGNP